MEPEQAKALLDEELRLIQEKVKAGKTLTPGERKMIQAAASGRSLATAGLRVTTKAELAKALKVTRETVDVIVKKARDIVLKGGKAPERLDNGSYDVNEWAAFASTVTKAKIHDASGAPVNAGAPIAISEKEKIAIEKARVDLEASKADLAIKQERWISKEDVRVEVQRCNAHVKSELKRRLLQVAPGQYESVEGSADECREINKRHLEEIFEHLFSGDWKQ